jgi:regulator of sigma E protease
MQFIISLIVFLLVLGFLVFIHELGHFAVAKWTGMRVDEFAIGFPPRLWAKKRGETTYAINAIPFGGYVKIHGETPHEEGEDADPRSFDQKPVWARLAVMLAGVTMNALFAIVALTVAFSFGFSSVAQDLSKVPGATVIKHDVLVTNVVKDGPADQADLHPGDFVREFITPDGTVREIRTINELVDYAKELQAAGYDHVTINYKRNGENATLVSKINPEGYALGVSIQSQDTVRVPVWQAPKVAVKETGAIIDVTWDALKAFGAKLFAHGQLDQNVSGPIGIYQATATATKVGFAEVLFIMIVLSLNLALLNLLPFPALDGGRVLFLIIEGIFRKRVIQRHIEHALTTLSFILLIGLMVILTARDIFHLFK